MTDPTDPSASTADWANMPLEKQVETIVTWFNLYYQDPQNETPYGDDDSSGNYTYIWGGPYNANEEIRAEFEGQASERAIEEAVDQVQEDGTFEWAPTPLHPERQKLEDADHEG